MPVLGSSSFPALSQITPLVRSLLNDVPGTTFSDTFLLPYVQAAYRRVNASLAVIKDSTYMKDNVFLVVPAIAAADPSVQIRIDDSTAPPNQLPVDLIEPAKLWERRNGSTDNFVEMTDMSEQGGLPSLAQGQQLIYWEWRDNALNFIGALQDTQIRLRYEAVPPDVASAASIVLLRYGQNVLAYFTANLAGLARGSPLAPQFEDKGVEALNTIKDRVIHQMQNRPRRRRAYSSRNSTYPFQ